MSLFPTLPIATSGMKVDQLWLDTIGGNVANASDVATPGKPLYRPQYLAAGPAPGGGVQVTGMPLGSPTGVLSYQPNNPLANAKGYVARPAVSLATEMVGLVSAQSEYQANAAVIRDATSAYRSALTIGS